MDGDRDGEEHGVHLGSTHRVTRRVHGWVRLADAGLARAAAVNAAAGVAALEARRLEEARTLRDLRSLGRRPPLRAARH